MWGRIPSRPSNGMRWALRPPRYLAGLDFSTTATATATEKHRLEPNPIISFQGQDSSQNCSKTKLGNLLAIEELQMLTLQM